MQANRCCCLYRKGKNFKANHNKRENNLRCCLAVAYIAKVRILKQITTDKLSLSSGRCCCLYRKGKNFKANHNRLSPMHHQMTAVAYIAKVRILKQITTAIVLLNVSASCCLYRKGKNFKANHNDWLKVHFGSDAVAYIAKVRILEQITTDVSCSSSTMSCCLYSKGKNFRANHNTILAYLRL